MPPGLAIPAALALGAFTVLATTQAPGQANAAPIDSVREAEEIIERASAFYRDLRSYSDSALIRHETHWAGNPDAQVHETPLEFRYESPNRFILRNERGGAYCDGERLWLHDADAHVYSESPAPQAVPLRDLDRRLPSVHLGSHPIARALLDRTPAPRAWGVEQILGLRDEARGGAVGHLVRAQGHGDIPAQAPSPMTLWFDRTTGLLGELDFDLTLAFRAANARDPEIRSGPAHVVRVTLSVRLSDVRVNEPLHVGDFAFDPSPDDQRVQEILSPLERAQDAQASMAGRPAPVFQRPLLDGGLFALPEAAGRVVVLYFWDTGSPASVASLARAAALAGRLDGEAVSVLGVNQDGRESLDRVERLVRREGALRAQILDSEAGLASAFALAGIPCTVVVDQHGVIHSVHPGPLLDHEKVVLNRVRALLALPGAGP